MTRETIELGIILVALALFLGVMIYSDITLNSLVEFKIDNTEELIKLSQNILQSIQNIPTP